MQNSNLGFSLCNTALTSHYSFHIRLPILLHSRTVTTPPPVCPTTTTTSCTTSCTTCTIDAVLVGLLAVTRVVAAGAGCGLRDEYLVVVHGGGDVVGGRIHSLGRGEWKNVEENYKKTLRQ